MDKKNIQKILQEIEDRFEGELRNTGNLFDYRQKKLIVGKLMEIYTRIVNHYIVEIQ
jgi:hypothetical protein